MTDENRKAIQHVADLINKNPNNISNYDWITITNGFRVDEMTTLLVRIANDDIFDNVADCIIKAWKDALAHYDPKCFDDYTDGSRRPRYEGKHSIAYEIDKIRKLRQLIIDNAKFNKAKKQNNKDEDPEARIKELESENQELRNQLEQWDEQIKKLEADLEEANAKLVEYDSAGNESVNYRYVTGKGKHIQLSDRERNIIEYVIHCVATQKTSLNANMKRLIGIEKTVGAHFNDSKDDASRPLSNEEKKNIKLVLDKENVDYGDLLDEHL